MRTNAAGNACKEQLYEKLTKLYKSLTRTNMIVVEILRKREQCVCMDIMTFKIFFSVPRTECTACLWNKFNDQKRLRMVKICVFLVPTYWREFSAPGASWSPLKWQPRKCLASTIPWSCPGPKRWAEGSPSPAAPTSCQSADWPDCPRT